MESETRERLQDEYDDYIAYVFEDGETFHVMAPSLEKAARAYEDYAGPFEALHLTLTVHIPDPTEEHTQWVGCGESGIEKLDADPRFKRATDMDSYRPTFTATCAAWVDFWSEEIEGSHVFSATVW